MTARVCTTFGAVGVAYTLLFACTPSSAPSAASPSPRATGQALEGSTDATSVEYVEPTYATDLDPDAGSVRFELVAAPTEGGLFPYAYNGQVPGPTLRATLGDRVTIHVRNDLDVPTSVHWHGLDVPFEMDGGATDETTEAQHGFIAPIEPGGERTYSFVVRQTGTFWYHPHFDTESQVDGGLYGAFVVTDPAEPVADVDLVWVLDTDAIEVGHTMKAAPHGLGGHRTEGGIAPRWLVNSALEPELELPAGTRARVRMVNASNGGYASLTWDGIRVIGYDQGRTGAVETPERIVLGPGDRAEVELLAGQTQFAIHADPYTMHGGAAWGERQTLVHIRPTGSGNTPTPIAWPLDAPAATPDPGHTDLRYTFAGSDTTGQWLINGESFPDVTVEAVTAGATPIAEVRNLSGTEHPFHTHGMRFEVLSINGVAPVYQRIEDTLNLAIRDVARLRLLPEELGTWMVHCHILPHAEQGMMTLLQVIP